jgi:hypothetical protein
MKMSDESYFDLDGEIAEEILAEEIVDEDKIDELEEIIEDIMYQTNL